MKFRHLLPILLFAIALLAQSAPATNITLEESVDVLLFNSTMAQFQAARDAHDPPHLNWTSDGCSYVESYPKGFNFMSSCQRHDFGYRNYKRQNRFTPENKADLDSKLLLDLYCVCGAVGANTPRQSMCYQIANVYYVGVALLGY